MMSGNQPELSLDNAYQMLVDNGYAAAAVSAEVRNERLVALAEKGFIGDIPLASLNTEQARDTAYDRLVASQRVPPRINQAQKQDFVSNYVFYAVYDTPRGG